MNPISNSLTKFLDDKLPHNNDTEHFIDDLEDEIFGISNRDFYLKYKGDIKELLDSNNIYQDDLCFESELLAALIEYCNQRKINKALK